MDLCSVIFAKEVSALFLSRKTGPTDRVTHLLDCFEERAITDAITHYASDRSAVHEFRQRMVEFMNGRPSLGLKYQQIRQKEGLPLLPLRKPRRRRPSLWSEEEAVGQADEAPM